MFTRLRLLADGYQVTALEGFPAVAAYADALLARPSIVGSVPAYFEALYHARMAKQKTWVWQRAQAA